MPLEVSDSIDIITTGKKGQTTLIITDAGITTDPLERNALFMQKINTYAQAIFSGSLVDDIPGFSADNCEIRVICATQPTPEMLEISAITPRGAGAEQAIPVEFELMGIEGDAASVTINRPAPEAPPVSDELQKLIDMAFAFGLDSSKDNSFVSSGFWTQGDGVSIAAFMTDEDTPVAARNHATQLPNEVRYYAVVYIGVMAGNGQKPTPAIIVEASERGSEKAVVFGQAYQPKKFLKKFAVVGEKQFLATVDTYLPEA